MSWAHLNDSHDGANHGGDADKKAKDLQGVHEDPLERPSRDVVLHDVHHDRQEHGEGPEAQRPHDACTSTSPMSQNPLHYLQPWSAASSLVRRLFVQAPTKRSARDHRGPDAALQACLMCKLDAQEAGRLLQGSLPWPCAAATCTAACLHCSGGLLKCFWHPIGHHSKGARVPCTLCMRWEFCNHAPTVDASQACARRWRAHRRYR